MLSLFERESQQGTINENEKDADEVEDEGHPSADQIESNEGMHED